MKFSFPEISYCFGGTPAVETIAAEVPSHRRRMTQGNSTKHWRPALAAIAEDGVAREVRRKRAESTASFRSEKKPLIKSKLAGKTRSGSYGSDYRESSHPMALPAFSPAPFLV
ncbi:uncharacterized protein LOC112525704 [Cynara cardunculus var. scolymus]|uniref:Uncharacterized protein n=1 Tax=Cynara cardunculus var. scolymus TaxID=59895 RepID=A0A103Y7Z9_CYNCS|nr:uncharacterized protein LOC112525704 [Cynara cardunculus var. scolymus]KVI04189.1 hypothetical protein Ccrd_017503 [Cynara cardunculus var. scolymus]